MTEDQSEFHAPGLKRMKRHNGRVDLYWVAREDLAKLGFKPKTQRLFGDWDNPSDAKLIAGRCRILQAEMLEWESGRKPSRNSHPFGTIAWLCASYETDEGSPFHDIRQASQKFYSRYLKTISQTVGKRRIDCLTGVDVREWFKKWERKHGNRSAYACIQTLRRAVSYGCELRNKDAMEFSIVLKNTKFKTPKSRKKKPTFEQIVAVRDAAKEAGHFSIALAVTLQFELGLRQKDVIGEWIGRRWQVGLTWDQINSDMILSKPTSKSNGDEIAEHDLRTHQDVIKELSLIVPDKRVGPVVICEETGRPWTPSNFSRKFRKCAKLAGWPNDLWNMDCRAGAVSEAFEAGAAAEDVMKTATHKNRG